TASLAEAVRWPPSRSAAVAHPASQEKWCASSRAARPGRQGQPPERRNPEGLSDAALQVYCKWGWGLLSGAGTTADIGRRTAESRPDARKAGALAGPLGPP